MSINYKSRLTNLQNRRFDQALNEAYLTKAFSSNEYPDNIKYLIESMQVIDRKYNQITLDACDNAKKHLEKDLNVQFMRAYRRQGSVETDTNIKVHSDIDLLTIIDRYHFLKPGMPNDSPYTASDPDTDIKELRRQAAQILNEAYKSVDESKEKCITIYNSNLRRYVDIVFAFWYNIPEYENGYNEFYRGVKIGSRFASADFPFAHISNVNGKGIATKDGSRKGIRLLKSLIADSETEIKKVKGFHVTSIVHAMDNAMVYFNGGNHIEIARAVSSQLQKVIEDSNYRQSIKSPNGCENPLTDDALVPELKLLKKDLDEVTSDAASEVLIAPRLRERVLLYS